MNFVRDVDLRSVVKVIVKTIDDINKRESFCFNENMYTESHTPSLECSKDHSMLIWHVK